MTFNFHTRYLSRKFSIQNINLKDEANMNDFKNSWQEFDVFTSRLKGKKNREILIWCNIYHFNIDVLSDIYPFILYFVSENL